MAKNSNKGKGSFDEIIYKKIGINQLILFCVYSVNLNHEECTFERLIKECFILFPKAFSFPKYAQWPDSRKLDRPLRSLRNKKLVKGDPGNFFTLTKNGAKEAKELAKALTQKKLW